MIDSARAFVSVSRRSLSFVRPGVFWPPATILLVLVAISVIAFERFLAGANIANRALLSSADWLFTTMAFIAVLLVAVVFVSPLGRVRIGGEKALPILSRWNWFAITLCTTVAVGILFWGAAEPMFHQSAPPAFTGLTPFSPGSDQFALSSVFLHWTITPYSLYAVTALAFALSHFNRGEAYSFAGPLATLTGPATAHRYGQILDCAALMALVAGVAAALGAGVMSISGGVERLTGIADGTLPRLFITLLIVAAFIVSSLSGLQRGVRILSDINVRVFFALAIFIFIAGPTTEIIARGVPAFWDYLRGFPAASLALGERSGDPWTQDWTVYFFANWLAWAPVTAMFLGRIAVGYTVREFVLFNVILPSLFGALWMTIFGAAAIELNGGAGGPIITALQDGGADMVTYALLDQLPFAGIASAIFLGTVFVSFVTAMDSNTLSITSLCLSDPEQSTEIRSQQAEGTPPGTAIKIFWGVLIGSLSFVMTATNGIDGVRILSNLGGAPGLVILLLSMVVLIRFVLKPARVEAKPGL